LLWLRCAMLVVETLHGFEQCQRNKEEPAAVDWGDYEMKQFVMNQNLSDIERHLHRSKFTVSRLKEFNYAKDGDVRLNDLCDREWALNPTQKHRLKFAIAALHPEPRRVFRKLVMIGNSGVGKSCILRRLCDDAFDPHYVGTIGVDLKTPTMVINERITIKFQIWDTAGQERFDTMTSSYYGKADVVFIVYNVSDEKSFVDVNDRCLPRIARYSQCSPKVLLIGNKTDEEPSRVVDSGRAQRFALENGLPLLEMSAKSGENVAVLQQWMVESVGVQVARNVQRGLESYIPHDIRASVGDAYVPLNGDAGDDSAKNDTECCCAARCVML